MRRATGNQSSRVVNFSGLHLIIAELELKTILALIANHKVLYGYYMYENTRIFLNGDHSIC